MAFRERGDGTAASDGFPLPPPTLRVRVVRTGHPGYFLDSGASEAKAIARLAAAAGSPVEEMDALLDFGCGCGRVARHWARLERTAVHGCDYNPELVAWCDANLPFMTTRVNSLAPPLPFERKFDLIYAISVFTHLSEPMQWAWIRELSEALAHGGLLLFTTLGPRFRDRLAGADGEAFDRGELVTRGTEVEGTNLCVAYHPDSLVAQMIEGLEPVESITDGLPGVSTNSPLSHQDVHLVRKPAAG